MVDRISVLSVLRYEWSKRRGHYVASFSAYFILHVLHVIRKASVVFLSAVWLRYISYVSFNEVMVAKLLTRFVDSRAR